MLSRIKDKLVPEKMPKLSWHFLVLAFFLCTTRSHSADVIVFEINQNSFSVTSAESTGIDRARLMDNANETSRTLLGFDIGQDTFSQQQLAARPSNDPIQDVVVLIEDRVNSTLLVEPLELVRSTIEEVNLVNEVVSRDLPVERGELAELVKTPTRLSSQDLASLMNDSEKSNSFSVPQSPSTPSLALDAQVIASSSKGQNVSVVQELLLQEESALQESQSAQQSWVRDISGDSVSDIGQPVQMGEEITAIEVIEAKVLPKQESADLALNEQTSKQEVEQERSEVPRYEVGGLAESVPVQAQTVLQQKEPPKNQSESSIAIDFREDFSQEQSEEFVVQNSVNEAFQVVEQKPEQKIELSQNTEVLNQPSDDIISSKAINYDMQVEGDSGVMLTEESIASISKIAFEQGDWAGDLPLFDAEMPVIDSEVARLQLDEWFDQIAKAPLVHPSVVAARFTEDQAISTINEAKSVLYPQVSISLSADSQRSIRGGEKVSTVQGLEASSELKLNPGLSVKQLLFDGGATESRVLAAESRSDAASSSRQSTEIGVALRAADTLIELAKLQEQLEAARDNLKEVSRLRDMIRERVNMGRDSPSEMLQMNARVYEARNQVVNLQGLRAEAGARHEETFGEPPVILAFPDVFAPIPLSVQSSIDVATRFNPDVVSARTLVDAASAEYKAAKKDGLPLVEVEARVNSYDLVGNGSNFYDTFLGLTVSQNLFDGGRQKAIEARSAKGVEKARAQNEQTMADVELALKRAYSNRQSLTPRYKSLQAQLNKNTKTRQAYEEQFIAGRRPLNDLVLAQQQVLDSALAVVTTKAELHRQHFTILALIGDLAVKPIRIDSLK